MTDEEFWKFVDDHKSDDTTRLRLKYHGDSEIFAAIDQIDLQRKSAEKFSSEQRRRLYSKLAVEQSTSSEIAEFHASLARNDKTILDMTMGLGTDATAFALLPETQVTAIERNPELAAISLINYKAFDNLEIIVGDSTEWLKNTNRNFDLIFIDPARRSDTGSRVFNLRDCTPDVIQLLDIIYHHAPRLIVKCSPMLDITSTIKEIAHTTEIYVIEQGGECRELLVIGERDKDISFDQVQITAQIGNRTFTYTIAQELSATGKFGTPAIGDYLYEPAAAIMKCGPFKLLCDRYDVSALSSNSHVYFSKRLLNSFPGKVRRIIGIEPYTSGNLKRFKAKWGNASVATRNFVQTADKLRSQLKVKESDGRRVIGTTDSKGNPVLIIADNNLSME